MAEHHLAGKPAPKELLIDSELLLEKFEKGRPDPDNTSERVAFGTSGHRGTSANCSFTRAHILAITQAICDFREANGINGPLFLGKDTHLLSAPAESCALEVLAANGVEAILQEGGGYTPTPVISHAILVHNRKKRGSPSDGIVITPSHNPPADGGLKYNPPSGGPADTTITKWIEQRANELLKQNNEGVKRCSPNKASGSIHHVDLAKKYIEDLPSILNLDLISKACVRIGVDPMGGAAVHYWGRIAEEYALDITVTNDSVDPRFAFMTVDHDGVIRMDCSSAFAMAGLVAMRERFDVAFGNDPDGDRHGIVTPAAGLLNSNYYLAAAVYYLFRNRPQWPASAKVGRTLVSSGIIARVAAGLNREVFEVPVGFKWFVDALLEGKAGFAGEESAGASFLRKDGEVWTTDKDGIILNLLAAEMTAVDKDPGQLFKEIVDLYGTPYYRRIDVPTTKDKKERLKNLKPTDVQAGVLAGESIISKETTASGNGAPIGGLKVSAKNGWFAARPSGTEDLYKIYAESFLGDEHLQSIIEEAEAMIGTVFSGME